MSARERDRADAAAKAFDAATPVGTRVLFWPGSRDGAGRASRTRGAAWVLGWSPVVEVEGCSGGIALTHVQVASEEEWSAAMSRVEAEQAEAAEAAEAAAAAAPTLARPGGGVITRADLLDVVRAQVGSARERDEDVVDAVLKHLATELVPATA